MDSIGITWSKMLPSSSLLILLSLADFSLGVERRRRFPEGLSSSEVVIQYTLYGEDRATRKWGGESAEEEEWDMTSTGSNRIAAAAVAAAPGSVDRTNKIIKYELEPLDPNIAIVLVGEFTFDEIDMQAARIIWGRQDLVCVFDRAGFEREENPPELSFGSTLEFPWDTIDVPVNGLRCRTLDATMGSELV